VIAGSHSYGTNTPESDMDFRGVCIPPIENLLGLDNKFEQYETKDPDSVIYSLKKFVRLALQNNPNILDALFVDDEHVVYANEYGRELRELKYSFLSKRVFHTYGGYAHSRLKNLTEKGKNPIGYKKELIDKYGFDSKDASHLVRLMRMGIEILRDGEVNVYRPDREVLLKVRNGEFTLDEIKEEYEWLNEQLNKAYNESKLPDQPDYNKINGWLIDTHRKSMEWNIN
jgi:predicted nucleotidyltransferase